MELSIQERLKDLRVERRNYDLCLDSSKLGFEKCVEEIKSYIAIRTKQ